MARLVIRGNTKFDLVDVEVAVVVAVVVAEVGVVDVKSVVVTEVELEVAGRYVLKFVEIEVSEFDDGVERPLAEDSRVEFESASILFR